MFVAFASSSPKDTAWPPPAFALLPAIFIFLVGLVGSILYVQWLKNTSFLIRIALDEGDIDRVLQLLKGMAKKDIHGYTYYNRYGITDSATSPSRSQGPLKRRDRLGQASCISSLPND
jgi:hypothetical protein